MKIAWMVGCAGAKENVERDTWDLFDLPMDGGIATSLPSLTEGVLFLAVEIGPYDEPPSLLHVEIRDPDMGVIGSIDQRYHGATRGQMHPEGDVALAFQAIPFQFAATQEGTYTFVAALDDQEPSTWPLTVLLERDD